VCGKRWYVCFSILLNMSDLSLTFILRTWLSLFFNAWAFMCSFLLLFFSFLGPSCVHIFFSFFQYFCIAHVSFAKNIRERDHMCNKEYLFGANERHVFCVLLVQKHHVYEVCTLSWSWEHDKFLNKGQQDLTKFNAKASSICIRFSHVSLDMALVQIFSPLKSMWSYGFWHFIKKKILQLLWIEKVGFPCQCHISLLNNLVNMLFLNDIFATSIKNM